MRQSRNKQCVPRALACRQAKQSIPVFDCERTNGVASALSFGRLPLSPGRCRQRRGHRLERGGLMNADRDTARASLARAQQAGAANAEANDHFSVKTNRRPDEIQAREHLELNLRGVLGDVGVWLLDRACCCCRCSRASRATDYDQRLVCACVCVCV